MQFIRPFKNFDPINGELHKKTPPVIDYYLEIAREILVNRNYDEIEYAISTINYLLHGGREFLVNSDLNNEEELTNKEKEITSIEEILNQIHADNKHFTPSSLLYDIYRSFDIKIENQEDFKNADWSEYFSVLAIAEIAEFQECDISSMHSVEMSSRSAEIAESIAFAKTFIDLNNLESRSSRHVLSLKGKKGGIQKNAASNEICAEYVDWFYSKYVPGKRKTEVKYSGAAEEFYEQRIRPLIEQDYLHPLASQKKGNALRMLETALREHRRSRGEL